MGKKSPAKMEILNQLCQKLNTHKHRHKTSPIGGCPSSSVPHLCSPPHPHPPLAGVKVGLAAQCPSPVPKPRALPHSQHAHPAPVALCQPPMPSDPLPDSPTAGPTSPVPPPRPKSPWAPPPPASPLPPRSRALPHAQGPSPGLTGAAGRAADCTCSRPHRPGPARPWLQPPADRHGVGYPGNPRHFRFPYASRGATVRHDAAPRPLPVARRGRRGGGRVSHVAARAARRHRRGGGGYVCVCVRVFDICDVFYN